MVLEAMYVHSTRVAIGMLLERTQEFLKLCPAEPVPGSLFAQELHDSAKPEPITTAVSIGGLALEFAVDHLHSYAKIITEPIETLSCFTCIRSMLETTAIGTWLLDPTITSFDRIARVFAVRFDAIDQQLKVGKCIGISSQQIQELEDRLAAIENEAIGMGYKQFRNRKNAIYAIGVKMPGATNMIRDVLNDEWMYRLLSAVAHGHHWAIIQLGFKDATAKAGPLNVSGIALTPLDKKVCVDGIVLLGLHGMLAFSRLIWNKSRYNGLNLLQIEEIFEDVADTLKAKPSVRFWRSKT